MSESRELLQMIVRKALDGRDVDRIIAAYEAEVLEEFADDRDSNDAEDKEREEILDLIPRSKIEDLLFDAYFKAYTRILKEDRDTVYGRFEFPALPQHELPRAVIVAIARAMGQRDAREDKALLDHYTAKRVAARIAR